MKEQVLTLVEQVNSKGWVAFHYPRRKQVAINGGRLKSYPEAIAYMKDMLKSA